MSNIASYLQSWASSYNPLTTLDFSNFINLTGIECYHCSSLTSVNLTNTPLLSRANFEGADLSNLDLSQSPALTDLRGAVQGSSSYAINFGTTGDDIWHICTRDNPQISSLPDMNQFPLLQQLWIWNDNQSGILHPTSTHLTSVLAYDNHYTTANFSGDFPSGSGTIDIHGNNLTSLDISNDPGLTSLDAHNNSLSQTTVDGILKTLDSYNTNGGTVNLTSNTAPSDTGQTYANNLAARGWTVSLDPNITSVKSSSQTNTATVTWDTNFLASTKLNYGLTNSYGSSTTETDTSPRVTSHSVTLSNLISCTTYHYQAVSIGATANEIDGSDKTFTTSGCTGSAAINDQVSSQITTSSGGTLTLLDSNSHGLTLTVPASFAGSNANFQAHQLDKTAVIDTTSTPTGYSTIGSYFYELSALSDPATKISTFDHSLTVSLAYGASDVSGTDESTLKIYRWDGSIWNQLSSCSVDTAAKPFLVQPLIFPPLHFSGKQVPTPIHQTPHQAAILLHQHPVAVIKFLKKKLLGYTGQ